MKYLILRGRVVHSLYDTYDEAFERTVALGWRDAEILEMDAYGRVWVVR